MRIFNRVQGIHRRVTGFCAGGGSSFAQKAGGARVFASLIESGVKIADLVTFPRPVKIWRKPHPARVFENRKAVSANSNPLKPDCHRMNLNRYMGSGAVWLAH
jgi:hypothetical protein